MCKKNCLLGFMVVLSCIVTVASANLMVNPGFETGDLSGWTGSNATVVSGIAHSGNYSAKVTDVLAGGLFGYVDQYPVGGSWAAGIASPGETVTVSTWLMSDPQDPIHTVQTVGILVSFWGMAGPAWTQQYAISPNILDGTQTPGVWKQGSFSLEVSEDYSSDVYVEVMLWCMDNGPVSGGTVYSDDWSVTIPEPATMSLLGLGLLGVLRRRRGL